MNSEQYSETDWIEHLYNNWARENLNNLSSLYDEKDQKIIKLYTELSFKAGYSGAFEDAIKSLQGLNK